MDTNVTAPADKPLAFYKVLTFASAAIPTAALALTLSVYLPRYFAGQVGVSLGAVGAAFTIVRFLDIGFDPLIGAVMDRTRTKLGRYRLWTLIGAPILMVACYALFMAKKGVDEAYLVIWLLILYIGNSIYLLSQAAWGAKLAPSYDMRSRLFAVIGAVGVLGAMLVLALPILTGGKNPGAASNVHAMGWFTIIILPIVTLLMALITPEPLTASAEPKQKFALREYWQMIARPDMARILLVDICVALGPGTTSALYLFFFHDSRGFSPQATNLLLMCYIVAGFAGPLVGQLAVKFGKHRTLIFCNLGYAACQASLFFVPKGVFWASVPGMVGCGMLAGGFLLLTRAMIADVGDAVRLETGKERTGLLYSLVTSLEKVGAAITIGVPLMILDKFGYNATEGAVNTPRAIHALEMCYFFAPVSFGILAGLVLFGYNLDADKHAEIRKLLAARDSLQGQAPIVEVVSGDGTLTTAQIDP